MHFEPGSPQTRFVIQLPSGDTVKTMNTWVEVPRKALPETAKIQIFSENHRGKSRPVSYELKFSGAQLAPVIRSAMQVRDGIVVGYSVRSHNNQYRIQYRPVGKEEDQNELITGLEGSAKIRLKMTGNYEVRIREENKDTNSNSQWSPWEKVKML